MIAHYNGRNTIAIYGTREGMQHGGAGLVETFQCSSADVVARNTALIQHGYIPAKPGNRDWTAEAVPNTATIEVIKPTSGDDEDTAPTYKGKTAAEWRALAQKSRDEAADSFVRCDTDGFLSQWAQTSMAREYDLCASLVEQGGRTEMQVPFVNGQVASVDLRDGQFGPYWFLTVEAARVVGKRYFTPSQANKAKTRRANNAKKGVTMGVILVRGEVKMLGGSIMSVAPHIVADERALRDGDFEVVAIDDDTTDY